MLKNIIQKTKLSVAMTAALVGGTIAGNAQAVNLTPDGLGDAALFSYFSAKSTWQTFVRLINTDSRNAIAVKVRFREAANSREILDFIVLMSPNDMWVGWTDAKALGGKPGIKTSDSSCIIPLTGSANAVGETFQQTAKAGLIAAQFKDRAFTGVNSDDYNAVGADKKTPTERMSEGHLEVIGIAAFPPGSDVYNAVEHENGKPESCTAAKSAFARSLTDVKGPAQPMGNVLAANAYMINVAAGQGGGYNPTMLANLVSSDDPSFRAYFDVLLSFMFNNGVMKPDLDTADPRSILLTSNELVVAGWELPPGTATPDGNANSKLARTGHTVNGNFLPVSGGVDAVSSLLMRTNVINEWAAKTGGKSIKEYYTQWVLNFPTKHYYVDIDVNKGAGGSYPTLACAPGSLSDAQNKLDAAISIAAAAEAVFEATAGLTNAEAQAMSSALAVQLAAAAGAPDFKITQPEIDAAITVAKAAAIAAGATAAEADSAIASAAGADFVNKLVAMAKAGALVNAHKAWGYSCEVSPGVINPDAYAPFTNRFQAKGKSCESYTMKLWNREEREIDFTSPEPDAKPELCYETNVISFNDNFAKQGLNSSFGSVVPSIFLPTDDSTGVTSKFGWANLRFTGKNATRTGLVSTNGIVLDSDLSALTPANLLTKINPPVLAGANAPLFAQGVGLQGLPVDGFLFSVFKTGSASNNHTAINAHKYQRNIIEIEKADAVMGKVVPLDANREGYP